MSIYRKSLRYLLTAASFIGFLLGWIFISHTSEPETTITTTTGQTLTIEMLPVPSVDDLAAPLTDTSELQTFTFSQNQSDFMPQMRTGGS